MHISHISEHFSIFLDTFHTILYTHAYIEVNRWLWFPIVKIYITSSMPEYNNEKKNLPETNTTTYFGMNIAYLVLAAILLNVFDAREEQPT